MLDNVFFTLRSYYAFYERYFSETWNHMTPIKYGMLLLGVGGFGWILMKTANKRS